MPTHSAKARILVKEGKAKVIQKTPFAIQLTYASPEIVQPVTVGIDDGGVNVGIAALSGDRVLHQEEIKLRTDIKTKLDTRGSYRRGRRNRKTRYRKARFLNRKQSLPSCKVCGGNAPSSEVICGACKREVKGVHQKYSAIKKTSFRVPPSIKSKKDAIVQAVKKLPLPIPQLIRLEDAFFDFQAMEKPDISGEQYQQGPLLYEKNFKTACQTRDGWKCRKCKTEKKLQVHHIKSRSEGGSDKLSNLMTLCEDCHEKHHQEGMKLPKQKSSFHMSAAHVMQGKNYLQRELKDIAKLDLTFGFITSYHRRQAEVEKTHSNDAVIIANKEAKPLSYRIQTNWMQSRKRSLHEATARKGRKEPNRTQKRNAKNTFQMKGFQRWDCVKIFGKVGFLSGFAGSSACRVVDIKGQYIKKPGKTYNNVNLSEVQKLYSVQGRISEIQRAS